MKKSKIVKGYDLSGVTSLHGLDHEQYFVLMEFQDFKCAISGFEFIYDDNKKRFIDSKGGALATATGKPLLRKAPPIDHAHESGFIRGILSENINWLENQWAHNTYGPIDKPSQITAYQNDPPAYKCIGRIVSSQFGKEGRRRKEVFGGEEKPNTIIAQLLGMEI